jgi:hypothetical protein
MEKPDMLKPALISGVIFGVASAIPFLNLLNCCCLLVLGCGICSAYLLIKKSTFFISYGQGALVGLLAGVFGAFATTILESIMEMLIGQRLKEMSYQFIEGFAQQIPPEAMEMIEQAIMEPFTISAMIMTLIFSLIIFGIFSTLGGILGVALFKKKQEVPTIPPGESI